MNKLILGIITLGSTYCGALNAGTMGPVDMPQWNGFYLGANAGGWWTKKDGINIVGAPGYINPLFPLGASEIANALAKVGTNSVSSSLNGFIGGGQIGYNYQVGNRVVAGVDADINGLVQSDKSSIINRVVPVNNFAENYTATVTIKKSIDYLGTVRGRLGVLFNPYLLIYGTGGFAYGDASLSESYVASESLGAASYPVIMQTIYRKSRTGWTAGLGLEWLFKSQWSARIEYSYYDLGHLNGNGVLNQINNLGVTPTLWGSANLLSSSKFVAEAVRIGAHYHFA